MLVEEACCWLGLGEEQTAAVQMKVGSGVHLVLILKCLYAALLVDR